MIRRLNLLFSCSALVLPVLLAGCSQVREQVEKNQYRQQALLRNSCQSNLSKLSLAVLMYKEDNDGRFPVVVSGGDKYGWADALRLADANIFQCPTEATAASGDSTSSGYTDYWFNSNLAGVRDKDINTPATTILFGEGGGGDVTDARYSKSNLPSAWVTGLDTPAKRHLGGSVYAYADGHTEWSKPEYLLKMVFRNG